MNPASILPRTIFAEEHEAFREQVRRFIAVEITPHHRQWEAAGQVPRAVWRQAGELGMLCCTVPQEWGGAGVDYRFSAVVLEELAYAQTPGPGFAIHSEMAVPYLVSFGTKAQKALWLPRLCSGEAVAGVAMTEPGAGSDLRGLRTLAHPEGDGYRLAGQKVFISNGQLGDVFIVAARIAGGGDALSLFLVEADRPGFARGRNLDKLGHHAQDTSEIFFNDVRLPAANLIGEAGQGLKYLGHGLARERLTICVTCVARAEAVLAETVTYVSQRELFGQRLADMQNTRFVLAGVKADLTAGRALVDRLIGDYVAGTLDSATAAAAKLWVTEMLGRCVDACLQLHGGWGYMTEYGVARAYADARVERIAGGSSEVMKEIIARTLLPRASRQQG
ncbi:putative acyl-CoA dehydrogenase [Bordetella hinzii CA90 BAL1384]|uniref:Acyl-[acyl-carrier-protein] dehydrogenase MbtN n=2 Tax=Bordetella hinzii TaxID=103855 RepID=A0ABR4R288_9BORD|nr:Acyl-CoA dehydrogenase [Bordetella hinzii]KCB24544.1 putative acyl-CoA dehydrogenase [Bordetella hinzii OH87 BAL007II]KCB34491.1 putative acyl-CoA dehydrogenase [Bordetella hinzii CA90 BAL1384]KCB39433.1 putative acyl-CoA dehydrogenase [Bordetella hinzii 5132]